MEPDTFTDSMDLKVRELLKEVRLDYSPAFTQLVEDTVLAIKDGIDKIPEDLKVWAQRSSIYVHDCLNGFLISVILSYLASQNKINKSMKAKEILRVTLSFIGTLGPQKPIGSLTIIEGIVLLTAPGFVRDIGADAKLSSNIRSQNLSQIGGSYAIQCVAECFHEKDYLNHRYHAKRCLYLCIIKKYLKLSSVVCKVEWSTLQNEARKPVLLVYPAMHLAEVPGFFVRIIPTAKSLFAIAKLNLNRNNVRVLNHGGTIPQATPKYNSSILEDMFLEDSTELIRKTFLGWKELGESSILLKVWARQRSSIYVHDCLNGFLISVILSYLASQNKINKSMKAKEILRVTLSFIATSELWTRGLFFKREGEKAIPKEERMPNRETFPVVICNQSAAFNLAFRVSKIGFIELQEEAALTLKCMEKCKDGGFEEIFMTRVDYASKYDYCMRLNLKGKSEVHASGFCFDDECWRLYEQKVHTLLTQGLTDRAKFIRVTWRNTSSECSIENGLSMFDREPLLVGVLVSSLEKAFRVVDIGPSAENKEEALKFRTFWGEKAELRRFKDGTIAESTVWESEHWARHLILKRISEYVLLRHLSLAKENVVHVVHELDFSLVHGISDPISFSGSLLGALEVLSKRLRLIQDLPLRVSSVQPIDPAFRFTSVFPPEPHPLANDEVDVPRLRKLTPSCIQPLELEGSGNWPMDELSIEKTKTAFLLKIGESLQNTWGMTCIATEDDVDVFTSGYVFRLKILHERGLDLVKREIGRDQVKQVTSADKELFVRSQHSSMINGFQGRYPVYAPVVRLAKRWVASHLFSACLVEEVVELLVAYLFVKPLPFNNAPCSRISGFLRFLRLLSEYDWSFSALVVDINGDLSQNDKREISDNFTLCRKDYEENKQHGRTAMFLAAAYDKASEAWTSFSPNLLELKRLVAYARSSANLLTKLILEEQIGSYKWECLFRTPLNNYDAVILLHRDKLPYPQRLLFPSELNHGKHVAHGKASKSFHPFMLPGDLKGSSKEKEFSNTIKLWYDSLGGDAIGITWEKFPAKKRGRDEVGEEGKDPVDVLKEVGEVGKGFVRSVFLLKAPRRMN
ncbi:Nucleolar protein 6 [Morella rubra]|uniref:Nucleolar protein 6 n=1 Tax=Morella rubra TaxID=262757 RepID=A0A6A1VMM6_9ROSI|nr:Nucleolar protein 6 [Morella rubra]